MDMAQTLLSTVGSLAATMMLFRSLLPPDLQYYISSFIYILFRRFSTQLTMVIDEFIGSSRDEIYEAAKIYLGSKTSSTTRRVRVSKSQKENIELAMERHEEVVEYYNGVKFKWVWVCVKKENTGKYANASARASYEIRSFELTFQKKHKDMVVKSYLPFVLKQAQIIKDAKKTLKIFTLDPDCIYPNSPYCWHSVRLNHPATFDTLAMDTNVKEMVMKDLERFVKRKEKYRKIGKAWKRGYLLYGPPGTGKSSLIAAMANYLSFNIYDLELTDITRNSKLRHALMGTTNRSILVVEDIDCTIELQERVSAGAKASKPKNSDKDKEESKVTLSGFLNFIDGLWSSIGDERIIIFTTNHKEKLDPALLRPGRMDLHVHMSYCTPCGFELLAANYLGIDYHERFGEIEELIRTTEVTPAEVAEQLLKNDNPDISLRGLIDFLHAKGKENEKAKAKQVAEAAAAEATAVGKEKEKKEAEKENEEEDEKKKEDEEKEKETENAGMKV